MATFFQQSRPVQGTDLVALVAGIFIATLGILGGWAASLLLGITLVACAAFALAKRFHPITRLAIAVMGSVAIVWAIIAATV